MNRIEAWKAAIAKDPELARVWAMIVEASDVVLPDPSATVDGAIRNNEEGRRPFFRTLTREASAEILEGFRTAVRNHPAVRGVIAAEAEAASARAAAAEESAAIRVEAVRLLNILGQLTESEVRALPHVDFEGDAPGTTGVILGTREYRDSDGTYHRTNRGVKVSCAKLTREHIPVLERLVSARNA